MRLTLTYRKGDHNLECARVDDVDSLRKSVVTYSRPFLGANVAQRGRTGRPKSTVATRLCLSTSMTEIVWPSVRASPLPNPPGLEREFFGRAKLAEPLLLPRITPHVIAVLLPKSRLVACDRFDALDPFGALPSVEAGNHKAQRSSVRRRNRFAVVGIRKKSVLGQEVVEGHVSRPVAIMSVNENVTRLREDLNVC